MAGAPEVKVRISGDQKGLDDALGKAEGSLGSFAGKLPIVGAAVAAVGAAVAAFAKGAVDEAAKAETGMVRLGAAVSNTGGDFRKLSPALEEAVAKVQRLSTATDDDLRAALTNMITISGDVSGSMKNLSLVTDVAAYSGKSLEESAILVGKAMTGNTKALGEFGNEVKLANDPLEALRETVGGFAEKQGATFAGSLERINNQWGEFQEAVGKAILGGGDAASMADGLAGTLANLVGWVEKNEDSFLVVRDAVLEAGGALLSIGRAVYDVVAPALGPTLKVVFGALLVSLNTVSLTVRTLSGLFKGLAGDTLESLGTIVEKGGKLLKVFGIDVVTETGQSLKEYGRNLKTSASDQVASAQETYKRGMQALFGQRQVATREIEDLEQTSQTRQTAIHARGQAERLTKAELAMQIHIENQRRANEIFEQVTKKLGEIATPALQQITVGWGTIRDEIEKVNRYMVLTGGEQKFLAEGAKLVAERQKDFTEEVERTRRKFEETVDSSVSIGLSLIGVAESMGKLDSRAASTLTSVINMGASLAKFGFASPQGLLSVINGLSQLIGGWGSSPAEQARKEAHLKNTRALEELSKDFGDYTGSTSGRAFQGVLGALGGIIGDVDADQLSAAGRNALSARIKANLPQALSEVGLSYNDALRLAGQYGIDVDKDPLGWYRLFQILKTRSFGAASSFTDQLASLEDSFGTLGIDDPDDQLAQFGDFLDKNVPALKGVMGDTSTAAGRAAAIAKLKDIYTKSITGKLAPAEYGKASPPQFRQIVSTLLRLLGSADGFLSNAQSVQPSTGVPTDTGPIPGGGATSGLVTGGVTPTVGVGGASFEGLDLGGGASIGTQNNTITLNVQPHPDETSAEFAERVATLVSDKLGTRYQRQLGALGNV